MGSAEIHERVLRICREVLRVDDLEIEDAHTAEDIPNYDSLAHIEILVRCQQVFGIALSALEAGQVANFGELKTLVGRKLRARG
jgi:acyl carrier protein